MQQAITIRQDTIRLTASSETIALIQQRGGCLFVSTRRHGRCGAVTLVDAVPSEPRAGTGYSHVNADAFDLFIDQNLRQLPKDLCIVRRGWFRHRFEAYWNGCAYIL